MRLLVLAALLFRAAAAAFFDAPRARGLPPRRPGAEHVARRTRRPMVPLMVASVDQHDQVRRGIYWPLLRTLLPSLAHPPLHPPTLTVRVAPRNPSRKVTGKLASSWTP